MESPILLIMQVGERCFCLLFDNKIKLKKLQSYVLLYVKYYVQISNQHKFSFASVANICIYEYITDDPVW